MLKVCKKGLSVLLALALILTLMPVSVLASGDVWDGQLRLQMKMPHIREARALRTTPLSSQRLKT